MLITLFLLRAYRLAHSLRPVAEPVSLSISMMMRLLRIWNRFQPCWSPVPIPQTNWLSVLVPPESTLKTMMVCSVIVLYCINVWFLFSLSLSLSLSLPPSLPPGITVGWEETSYITNEGDNMVELCAVILSPSMPALIDRDPFTLIPTCPSGSAGK